MVTTYRFHENKNLRYLSAILITRYNYYDINNKCINIYTSMKVYGQYVLLPHYLTTLHVDIFSFTEKPLKHIQLYRRYFTINTGPGAFALSDRISL